MKKQPSRSLALVETLIVSTLWGSSYIFVKIALEELGPLTIGGLRYFFGFLILLPFMRRASFKLSRAQWLRLGLVGLSAYTIGNGALFFALQYLPATTVSFLMGSITIAVLLGGIIWLKELPTRVQMTGILLAMGGLGLFFSPGFKAGEPLGLLIFLIALVGFTAFGLLGRTIARIQEVDTLTLTALPLAIGGGLLLLLAFPLEGLPTASPRTWGLVLWLAAFNTALGYMLYNHALQVVTAVQINVLLNLTPIWTALIGWVLLGEKLLSIQWLAIALVMLGAALAQNKKKS